MARTPLIKDNWIVQDLKNARLNQGLRLYDVAEKVGVNRETIGGWERGKVAPAIDKLIIWAVSLGYTLELVKG